jgi:hypothetical protein
MHSRTGKKVSCSDGVRFQVLELMQIIFKKKRIPLLFKLNLIMIKV